MAAVAAYPRQRLVTYRMDDPASSWLMSMPPDQYCPNFTTPSRGYEQPNDYWPDMTRDGLHPIAGLNDYACASQTQDEASKVRSTSLPEDSKRRRRKYGPKPEPPYSCFCGKVFKRHEHMLRHRATHDDGIKYDCKICGKSFRRQDVMHRHTLTHNTSNCNRKGSRTSQRGKRGSNKGSTQPHTTSLPNNASPSQSNVSSEDGHHHDSPSLRPTSYGRLPKYPSNENLYDQGQVNMTLPQYFTSNTDTRAASVPLDVPLMGMTPPPPFQACPLFGNFANHHGALCPSSFEERGGERTYWYASSVDSGYVDGLAADDASEWANDGASRDYQPSPCLSATGDHHALVPAFASRSSGSHTECTDVWPLPIPSQTEAQSSMTAVIASSFHPNFGQMNALPAYSNTYFALNSQAARQSRTPRTSSGNDTNFWLPHQVDACSNRASFTTPRTTFRSSMPTSTAPSSTSEVFASSKLSRFVHNPLMSTPAASTTSNFRTPQSDDQGNCRSDVEGYQRKADRQVSQEDHRVINCSLSGTSDVFATASPLTEVSDEDSNKVCASPTLTQGATSKSGASLIDSQLVSPVPLHLSNLPPPSLTLRH